MTWEELNNQTKGIKSSIEKKTTISGWDALNSQYQGLYKTPQQAEKDYREGVLNIIGENKGKTTTKSNISAWDVAKELPGQIVKNFSKNVTDAGKAIVNTLFPSISEFTKTTTGIMGEGLAYLIDPTVREMYDKGNTEILPYITKTSVADVAKKTAGAGIETAVWWVVPSTLKTSVLKRFGIGSLQGLGIAIAEGLSKDLSAKDIIKNSITYGATAGAVEMIAPYIPVILSTKIKDLPNITGKTLQSLKNELSKPLQKTVTEGVGDVVSKIKFTEEPIEIFDNATKKLVSGAEQIEIPPKKIVSEIAEEPGIGQLKAIEGTGELKPRGAAVSVEAKAIEKKLVSELGELPTYKTVNFTEQAQKAVKFLNEDVERAVKVAMGKEIAPSGVLPEAIFKAVENKAIKEADVDLIRKLGTSSRLLEEETTMGQRIGYLREKNPESSIAAIKDIVKSRKAAVETRIKDISSAKNKIISSIKEEISKTSPKKQTWSEFIKSLSC